VQEVIDMVPAGILNKTIDIQKLIRLKDEYF
jgi:hypothetical protein